MQIRNLEICGAKLDEIFFMKEMREGRLKAKNVLFPFV